MCDLDVFRALFGNRFWNLFATRRRSAIRRHPRSFYRAMLEELHLQGVNATGVAFPSLNTVLAKPSKHSLEVMTGFEIAHSAFDSNELIRDTLLKPIHLLF